ncbi:4-hydroxythreonine-4-phosphate dehydrogenase PdxA [bacterium]|nr:4-hydroxythreonine-4-phosphate dehydrogenase PdxA [bacterium]
MSRHKDNQTIRLGITLGDPAGIGPEIVLKTLRSDRLPAGLEIVLFSNVFLLRDRAEFLGLTAHIEQVKDNAELVIDGRRYQIIDPTGWGDQMIEPGQPSPENASGILRCLDYAVRWALEDKIHALVTAPLSKEVIRLGGYPSFTGHTEYLGQLTGNRYPVMMLATAKLRVVLATTHIPFRHIISTLEPEKMLATLVITHEWLIKYLKREPKMAVAALNPHAGEGGTLGSEEDELILPVLLKARRKGIVVSGPLPADTVFQRAGSGEFDVVLALYHDQGMIPIKLDPSTRAVNITLGLPIIRTSPDHGTAFAIADQNKADSRSFQLAVQCAYDLAVAHKGHC